MYGTYIILTRVQKGRGWTEQGGDVGITDWTYANWADFIY